MNSIFYNAYVVHIRKYCDSEMNQGPDFDVFTNFQHTWIGNSNIYESVLMAQEISLENLLDFNVSCPPEYKEIVFGMPSSCIYMHAPLTNAWTVRWILFMFTI